MSSILNLVIYILLVVFLISAASGIVMFFIDMIRFSAPHKRFEVVSSIEKYNERMSEKEKELKEVQAATPADKQGSIPETIEIDL